MSRSGDITLSFGGEERTFRLAIGQWRKIQEKCDAGPGEILARLSPVFAAAQRGLKLEQMVELGYLGAWRVDDVREVILQGRLGAGAPINEVTKEVRDWVDERPLLEPLAIAYRIVLASMIGAEDEKAMGESPAAAEGSPHSPAASSGSETTASTQ